MEQEYKYMVCTRCMTYNHAPYIVDAMNGFTMQETTFPVYYLITDDASTDGEPEVIRKYLSEHFQAPYRVEETDDFYLVCANHNTNPNCIFIVFFLKYNHYSIKKSKMPYLSEWQDNAKYIAICEGDDYWIDNKKIQKQVDFLENNEDYSMVFTDGIIVNEKGVFICEKKSLDYSDNATRQLLKSGNDILTATILFRNVMKEWNKEIEQIPFRLKMGDYPLYIFLSTLGKLKKLNCKTAAYRIMPESASHSSDKNKLLSFIDNSERISKFFNARYHVGLPDKEIERRHLKGKARLMAKYSRRDFCNYWRLLLQKYPLSLFDIRLSAIAFVRIVLNKNK